jgi:hypothetical protein
VTPPRPGARYILELTYHRADTPVFRDPPRSIHDPDADQAAMVALERGARGVLLPTPRLFGAGTATFEVIGPTGTVLTRRRWRVVELNPQQDLELWSFERPLEPGDYRMRIVVAPPPGAPIAEPETLQVTYRLTPATP